MKRRTAGTPRYELRARSVPPAEALPIPLVHVTAVGIAREILGSRQLETRRCDVFNHQLLYFFALKPAYGLKDGDEKSHQINRFPFAFVVRPEAVETPFHVYPFDTGAAAKGIFAAADPYIFLDDYELLPEHSAIAGHIAWAFGCSQAYYDGDLRLEIAQGVPDFETSTRGYLDVARMSASGSNQPDARASAIEVACNHHVRLKGNVLLAVIPLQYLEGESGQEPNQDFLAKLKAEDIPYKTYDWKANLTPNSFRAEITKIIRAFYEGPPKRW